ncbi:hypothetical protein KFK09_015890 [Dendrobium nobile]|uniref:Uncharacterized protein n=1 Tax=Dendrobium nobile TaxID=94219 RepID=A0A8T3B8K7_DENNO|nr:hypothetical protein KFK09_015890 [Dendrobium nobile]
MISFKPISFALVVIPWMFLLIICNRIYLVVCFLLMIILLLKRLERELMKILIDENFELWSSIIDSKGFCLSRSKT